MTCPRCKQALPAYRFDPAAKAIEHRDCSQPDVVIAYLDGPDRLGRYTYFLHWQTNRPPYCSRCGSGHLTDEPDGVVSCVRCGLRGPMPRAQIFFTKEAA